MSFVSLLALACGQSSRANDAANPSGAGATGGSATSGGSSGTTGGSGGSGGKAGSGSLSGGSGGSDTGGGGGLGEAGSSAGSSGEPNGSGVSLNGEPFYTRVQRLTNAQWERAVTDILRLSAPANLSQNFASPVVGGAEFTNNERLLFVNAQTVSDLEVAAEAAAALATGTPDALAALVAGADVATFVQTFGRRAFRRPLLSEELTKYTEVFALGETLYGPGFANGAALVVRAMLQSPHFVYRSELGPSGEPLTSYEVASKLSFLLLGTTPSDALLDAADRDELATVEGLEAFARDMLEQPAAVDVLRDFHGQLHHLSRYRDVNKAGVPEYDPAVNAELEAASTRFFDGVFTRGEGLREIFTSTRGFVGPGLAPLYGIEPAPSALSERDLGPSRLGYFLQVPFLMMTGINREPNPIHRGLTLVADVLCADLPLPPMLIPPIPPVDSGQTNRERISELTAGCGDCHTVYIDPLGFSFEGFDGMGQERATDNGKPVDTTGRYPFGEGTKEFASAGELMNVLAGSQQAHTCYAKKLTGYALQRDIAEADRPTLEALGAVSELESVKETIVALVKDPAFRVRAQGTP